MFGLSERTEDEKCRFLAVVCIDNVASMSSEMSAIVIVAGARCVSAAQCMFGYVSDGVVHRA